MANEEDIEVFFEDEMDLDEAARSGRFIATIKNDEHAQGKIKALKAKHGSIRVRGRLGKDSKHAASYKGKTPGSEYAPGYSKSRDIKPEHASHFDVYRTKDVKEENMEMNEEGIAAASLHPAARSVSDDKALSDSKVSMMKQMLHMASGMGKEDMTQWFDKAMALIGHEADKVGDKSGQNQSSVDMTSGSGPKTKYPMVKIASITPGQSMKEDVEELFAGEELSEEFKEKAATIFEAAVAVKALMVEEELKEQFETKLAEEVARIEAETAENLDKYLDYVVEEWMKENEVAIESSLRTEMTADFIEGLKTLFAEHYIELPEDKVDVVEQMADKVEELEKKLDEMISENNELKEELVGAQLVDVVEELASDLALTQQEKFKSLAEEIEFDGDVDHFKKKLEIVKETYFTDEKPAVSNIEEETFEGEVIEEQTIDPRVRNYVTAISRTVKK